MVSEPITDLSVFLGGVCSFGPVRHCVCIWGGGGGGGGGGAVVFHIPHWISISFSLNLEEAF